MFVVGCEVLHINTHWRSGSSWLQNLKVHKNAMASPKVYKFSNWVSVSCDDFKIKHLYPVRV